MLLVAKGFEDWVDGSGTIDLGLFPTRNSPKGAPCVPSLHISNRFGCLFSALVRNSTASRGLRTAFCICCCALV